MEIKELQLLITALEFYLKSKQQLNNASNDDINDIKYLIWQLKDDLQKEITRQKIYGEQRYQVSSWRPVRRHRKRPYFKK